MPIEVPMGAISPTMASGQIVEWRVKVGDKVKEGDTLADVQTDKAVMPLESFDEGIVAVLCAEVGEEVAVGQPVLILAAKGEDPKAIAAASGGGQGRRRRAGPGRRPRPSPRPKHEAQGAGVPYREMTSSPTRPEVSNGQEQHAATATEVHDGGRIKSSPLARKIAAVGQGRPRPGPADRPRRPGDPPRRRGLPRLPARRRGRRRPGPAKAAPAARPAAAAGRRPADPAHADAEDDRRPDGPGQAVGPRDPRRRRHPGRRGRRDPRAAQQAARRREDQALGGRLRDQGRRPGPPQATPASTPPSSPRRSSSTPRSTSGSPSPSKAA